MTEHVHERPYQYTCKTASLNFITCSTYFAASSPLFWVECGGHYVGKWSSACPEDAWLFYRASSGITAGQSSLTMKTVMTERCRADSRERPLSPHRLCKAMARSLLGLSCCRYHGTEGMASANFVQQYLWLMGYDKIKQCKAKNTCATVQ